MMSYALENKGEVERLEGQSHTELYDYRRELSDFIPKVIGPLLDAGSGSGILSRYLAERVKDLNVIGCDFSTDRIDGARRLAEHLPNVQFIATDLTRLPFPADHFGSAVCRFVIEHILPGGQYAAVKEIFRCLKPGAWVCLIDLDGMYHNLFPRPESTEELLRLLEQDKTVDLQVGRRLPHLLSEAGFSNIQWRIETMAFQGKHLETEERLTRERLSNAKPLITRLLGSDDKAKRFETEFIETMRKPGSTLFYNKFIAMAQKPLLKVVSR